MHPGMSYARLEALGGIQWPCLDEDDPGSEFLHGRLWERPIEGPPAPFHPVEFVPPVDELSDDYPIRLTTGRRLDSYNTGLRRSGYASPLRRGESVDIAPEDGARLRIGDGERARVTSRRGSVEAPARYDASLRPGLAFMTLHFPRRGRHEPAHHRRLGPALRHLRVQGHRRPHRAHRGAQAARRRGRLVVAPT